MDNLVSVVIPTYKRRYQTIVAAVKSVINQTYKNIEIILVDDNTDSIYTTEVKKVCEKYSQITYLSNGGNKGACAARNKGILNAKGEFIAFLDDDDSWDNKKIEKQLKLFTTRDVGFVYCGMTCFYEKEKLTIVKPAIKHDNPWRELLISNYIGTTSCGLVRRSAAIDVGMFDVNLKSGQDLDFWIRLSLKYKIDCVKESLLTYTFYENNTISSNLNNRLISNFYLKDKYTIIQTDKELRTVYNLKIVKAYIVIKNYFSAFTYFLRTFLKGEISLKFAIKHLRKIKN